MKKTLLTLLLLTGVFTLSWSQCSLTPDFYDDYSTSTGWTGVDKTNHSTSPNVTIAGGVVNYNNVLGGREQRLVKALPFTLNDAGFVAECKLRMTGGNAPSHIIMSFTENNNDTWYTQTGLLSECSTFSGTNTNQDALLCYVMQTVGGGVTTTCCPQSSSWQVIVGYKDGTTLTLGASTGISVPSPFTNYYVRMQRTTATSGVISVFSDSTMTTHVSGSPQCFSMPSTVQDLSYVQHGVANGANCKRSLSAQIDDLKLYNGASPCPLAMNPVIAPDSVLCAMDPFIFDGSASSSGTGLPITSHSWSVVPCTSTGYVFPFEIEWVDNLSGAPGIYTLPNISLGGPSMPCGAYYKITLAVTNCGNELAATSMIVYIECPISDLIPSQTEVCYGGSVDLLAYQNYYGDHMPTYTYTWNMLLPTSQTLAVDTTLNPYTVYPLGSSTYQVIATSQNGCVSSAQVSVSIIGGSYYRNISTGYDNSIYGINTPGNDDDEWIVANDPYTPYAQCVYPVTSGGGSPFWYDPTGTQVLWISGFAAGGYADCILGSSTNSYYDYQYQVTLPTTYNNYMLIIDKFAADDYGAIYLNGDTIPALTLSSAYLTSNSNYTVGTTSTIALALPSGPNTILVKTLNKPHGCNTGMLLNGYIVGDCQGARPMATTNHENVLSNVLKEEMRVYPNPAAGMVKLAFDESIVSDKPATITIYNSMGMIVRKIDEKQLINGYSMDLKDLEKGMYLIEVTTVEKRMSQQLILE